ncbi:MAG: LamG domain-containing protein, partial [Planctomycetota bacterium]
MYRRFIYLMPFVLMLGTAGSASAELVAYWSFDEGSGDRVFDSSGNGNDGTINGASWGEGKYGPALHFNAQDNYVEVPTSESLETETNVTVAAWINWIDAGDGWLCILANGQQGGPWENYGLFVNRGGGFLYFTLSLDGGHVTQQTPNNAVQPDEWLHACATWDGSMARIYVNGEMVLGQAQSGTLVPPGLPLRIGHRDGSAHYYNGIIDDVRVYNHALTEVEILAAMEGGLGYPYALGPNPEDGALYEDTWVNLSWLPGSFAVSHDVYLGDNFDDVNDGLGDTFRGNQDSTFLVAGFPGFPYPDGLVPGTTYYWRIDEVNEAEPNSPWKGAVWSFSVPPKTAYFPDPANGAEFVDPNAVLSWTPGFGARIHTVYFGDNFDDVNDATDGAPSGTTSYTAAMEREKVYYWRVDEFDALATYKGDVWAFTTPGSVGNPQPANGAVDVQMIATLSWTPADNAASHELYFGADADVVKNATTASPEYIGPKALGAESYDPGGLAWDSSYAWRVDEVYPDGTVEGLVWSFATADFILVDDFESYNDIDPPDPNSNRIFDKWKDGFGTTDNGALIGNDLPPYAEQTIVNSGAQSMIYRYDNANKTSETTMTLVYPRDWSDQGVTKLSLWFRGASGNSAERMFV